MTLPRNFKMTARMSTGGNAPRRRLMGVRRPLRCQRVGQTPATSRRSARIARRSGVIDAVTEAVILNFDLRPKRPQRVRHKITARRDDGSYMNRVQLATRAAELAMQESLAEEARITAEAAARIAAFRAIAEIKANELTELTEAAYFPGPASPIDLTHSDDDDDVYEPSSPEYAPDWRIQLADRYYEYYGVAEEDDVQCTQPLSPLI